ncbi:MAG: S41 family peptidase [Kiloniellaceae bacterium]
MGGPVETAAGSWRRGAWRRLGTLALAFLIAACAAPDTRAPADYDPSHASRLLSISYQDIADIYIDEINVSDLALAGLNSLSSIEPDMAITRVGGRIKLSFAGQQVGSFTTPARQDADGWGRLTAAVLKIGRDRSDKLNSAETETLYETVFDGVLGELDSFSRYAGREEARENRASRDGFGGIGVRIRLVEEGVRILSVMENTPAERAGLVDNDVITDIDFVPTTGLNQREVVRRLRGPLRSRVELTIKRMNQPNPIFVSLVRAHIVPQTVKYTRMGDIGYIQIAGFNQSTARALREKIRLAKAEIGPRLRGFMIDMRGNPGGLLDQAVAVADLLISHGRIVSTHGRHPDSHQYFDAAPDDLAKNRPLVVLINGNSASATEIVAASLQDSGRAVVVGSGSFGKGTVQTVLRLPNEGELTLTWARFHAPSGYALHRRGVLPDICTTDEDRDAEQVLQRLRSGLLPIDEATRHKEVDPRDDQKLESLRDRCPPRQSDSDIDLQVAKRLLGDPELYARALGNKIPDTAELEPDQAAAHSH